MPLGFLQRFGGPRRASVLFKLRRERGVRHSPKRGPLSVYSQLYTVRRAQSVLHKIWRQDLKRRRKQLPIWLPRRDRKALKMAAATVNACQAEPRRGPDPVDGEKRAGMRRTMGSPRVLKVSGAPRERRRPNAGTAAAWKSHCWAAPNTPESRRGCRSPLDSPQAGEGDSASRRSGTAGSPHKEQRRPRAGTVAA